MSQALSHMRDSRRIRASLTVRYCINDGPQLTSRTINLTDKSLAINSDELVSIGDVVRAEVAGLPTLEGRIARIWEEGFAIRFEPSSSALVALAKNSNGEAADLKRRRKPSGPPLHEFPLVADTRAFGRLRGDSDASWSGRHHLAVVAQEGFDPDAIRHVWLSIGELRWIARTILSKHRQGRPCVAVSLNAWQIQIAATHGLDIVVTSHRGEEWRAYARKEAFDAYIAKLN